MTTSAGPSSSGVGSCRTFRSSSGSWVEPLRRRFRAHRYGRGPDKVWTRFETESRPISRSESALRSREERRSGGRDGLLELAEAVDKTPHAIGASVEVGGTAEADPHGDRVVAANPAHVIEVEDLASLSVELKGG